MVVSAVAATAHVLAPAAAPSDVTVGVPTRAVVPAEPPRTIAPSIFQCALSVLDCLFATTNAVKDIAMLLDNVS